MDITIKISKGYCYDKKKLYRAPGPVESEINDNWKKASSLTRKELGGSKSEVAKTIGLLLKDEYNIDIIEEINLNADPCYAVDKEAKDLDWEFDYDEGYKRLKKILKNKNIDYGTALYCYWCITPDYYTQFKDVSEITKKNDKAAFKILKEIESRLLSDDFKSRKLKFDPKEDAGIETERLRSIKWSIPEILIQSSIE